MTTQELKAVAYDLIRQIEMTENKKQQIIQQLQEVNKEIALAEESEKTVETVDGK